MVQENQKTRKMEYKHFSHQHPLTLTIAEPNQHLQICHACQSPCHGSIFTCRTCNFFIHDHCANANRYVKHPSHSSHPLVLMPGPTYCSGSFLCNACGRPGSSFSYCCPLCEVDLHMGCAILPPKVIHNSHQHEICLSFTTPEKSNSCRICTKELTCRNWSYFCERVECDFRVHTFCATSEVRTGLYQTESQPIVDQGMPMNQPHIRTEEEWTPEEMALEINRMRMEYQMAQSLANIIAYYPN